MKTIIGILTIVAFAFTGWMWIDKQKADCSDVQRLEVAFNYHQTKEMRDRKQQQLLDIEMKYPDKSKMPPEMRKLYEEMRQDKKDYEKQLDKMEKK